MPVYEYQCNKCSGVVEQFFKMADKPSEIKTNCPHCSTPSTLNFIISAVAMSYNGFNHAAKVPTDLKNRLDQIKKHYPDMQSTV